MHLSILPAELSGAGIQSDCDVLHDQHCNTACVAVSMALCGDAPSCINNINNIGLLSPPNLNGFAPGKTNVAAELVAAHDCSGGAGFGAAPRQGAAIGREVEVGFNAGVKAAVNKAKEFRSGGGAKSHADAAVNAFAGLKHDVRVAGVHHVISAGAAPAAGFGSVFFGEFTDTAIA